MFPIVISLSIWVSELANKCVLFHTDNLGLVDIINKKTTKDNKLLVLLRELVLQCLKQYFISGGSHPRFIALTGHEIQVPGTGHGPQTNLTSTTSSTGELAFVAQTLLSASLSFPRTLTSAHGAYSQYGHSPF